MYKIAMSLLTLFSIILPSIAQEDVENSVDPALFSRMPGYYIYQYDDFEFNKYDFPVDGDKTQPIEGHYLSIYYYPKENTQPPSPLQVVRNYINAIKKAGGQLVYEFEDGGYQNAILKLAKNGMETWAHVTSAENDFYTVVIVEKKSMKEHFNNLLSSHIHMMIMAGL
jgi:hypothetical protein